MHVLITGGAGFIGSHLAEKYLAAGHKVTVVDDLSTGSVDNIAAVEVQWTTLPLSSQIRISSLSVIPCEIPARCIC
jgi:nucleoside-diphosphate-sugar epimerase